jgi:hypothetical protein
MEEKNEGVEANEGEAQRPGENPMAGKVSGYRKLDEDELAMVNQIKAAGPAIQAMLDDVGSLIAARTKKYPAPDSEDYRALALAKTNLQQGFMWLIRAAASPTGLV